MIRRTLLLVLTLAATLDALAGTGRVIIRNRDSAREGFNDATPVAPVGLNAGTTLGEQRLNVFNAAAAAFSKVLDTNVDIIVSASFSRIGGCTATSGVLGHARPLGWQRDFAAAPRPNTWYPIALANKLSNKDLDPSSSDITITFNSAVDDATCLGASNWYYGLDRNHAGHIDLFVVVLHELAHGLGIAGNGGSPSFAGNMPAIFDVHTLDLTTGRRWDQMTEQERHLSLENTGNLVWAGEQVRANTALFLQPVTTLTITEPSAAARNYDIGTAVFGAAANRSGMSGRIVRATDDASDEGASPTDGCSAFSNAASIAGNIALIDRGGCTFVQKARNAQAAGAVGALIADNRRETCLPPGMSGEAPDVTIPVISITQDDGDKLKAELAKNAPVRGMTRNDPSQLAGTTKEGYVRLYAPCTDEPGSSTHHWDTVSSPNLLMEPSINSDLRHGLDLTLYQLLDIGWTLPPKTGRPFLKRK